MELKELSLLFYSQANNFIFYFFLSDKSKGDAEETPKQSEEEKTPESEEAAAQEDESSAEKQWNISQ